MCNAIKQTFFARYLVRDSFFSLSLCLQGKEEEEEEKSARQRLVLKRWCLAQTTLNKVFVCHHLGKTLVKMGNRKIGNDDGKKKKFFFSIIALSRSIVSESCALFYMCVCFPKNTPS